MERFVCIHGHFYQPPRENPWLEEVELQDSAYPYHDWNERITSECYAPNTASRILSPEGKIADIINNYSKINFNFGPTLLSWMEKFSPDTYQGILDADKLSRERFSGHGSAIAQVYNHMIMPLANERDKETQVKWGIYDFQKRFGRPPEGIWLAETAVDTQTLEILAANGIKYTILAPRQAQAVRKMFEGEEWDDVSCANVDPTMAYLCPLPSGRTINLFFYDGPISQSIAFGGLLENGKKLADKLVGAFNDSREHNQLVHIATDGESYGHHHHNGDMALSYCLHYLESNNLAKITNYGEFLEHFPPSHEAAIVENSSWSCGHGIERWRENCGCNTGRPGWHQEWRKPLRDSLDFLRESVSEIYEEHGGKFLKDVWEARNNYIEVVMDRSAENIENFFEKHALNKLNQEEKIKVLKLLEMQRNAMLMYTSCGWFFDEISGLETVQILQYASKVIQYAEEFTDLNLETEFIKYLELAPSNVHENMNYIYDNFVKPVRLDLLRVAAHYAISSLFENYREDTVIGAYTAHKEIFDIAEAGKLKLATGKLRIVSDITWEEESFCFAVLHLGDNNINCGIQKCQDNDKIQQIEHEIHGAFNRGDVSEVIKLMTLYFGDHNYSLYHLFRDQQRKILNQILELTYEGIEVSYRQIYENNYSTMSFFKSLYIPLPKPVLQAANYIINADLKKLFEAENIDLNRLDSLINDAGRWSIELDKNLISYIAGKRIYSILEQVAVEPENIEKLGQAEKILNSLSTLDIRLKFWKSQNIYYSIAREIYPEMQSRAENGQEESGKWLEIFNNIGEYLRFDINEL